MGRIFLVLLFFFNFGTLVFGQAVLRVGDPIELKIGGVPNEEQQQVNNIYTVDANGSVSLPYINKVKAEGLTPAQLARSIEEAYRANKIYTNPNITILMRPTSRFVNVGGAVRLPVAEELYTRLLTLPLHVDLTDVDQDRVVQAVREAVGETTRSLQPAYA